jgi:hypothetical protein
MPNFRRAFLLALPAAAVMAGTGVVPAFAHNAAHIYIDGRCLDVGSGKDAPYVGGGAPQTAGGQLDLIYDPKSGVDVSDQYGARLAAIEGSTPLLPGDCPP